jgi:hypothetical protein
MVMADETAISAGDIKRIAEKALLLQRHILKRAWGISYAVWAAQLAVVFCLPLLFLAFGFQSDTEAILRLTLNVAFNIAGLGAVLWIFKRIRDTHLVREAVNKATNVKKRNTLLVASVFAVYYLIIAAAFIFFRPHAEAVLSVLLTTTIPSIYYGLKASFQKKLPREGIAAMVVYSFSTTASLIAAFLNLNSSVYPLLWAPTIIALLLASLLSLLEKAPQPLEDTEE